MSRDQPAPLSILFAIQTLPPMGGGAEIHAARLATALRARGHSVRIQTVAEDSARTTTNPVLSQGSTIARRLYSLRVARTILFGRGRYSVVHFFLGGRHTAIGGLACRVAGCPHVVMYGGSGAFDEMGASLLGRLALKADARLARRLIALNEGMRQSFRACGAPDDRIVILPCEADPDFFSPGDPDAVGAIRTRFAIPPEAHVISFVGRLVTDKALPTLVAAFGRLSRADPRAVLVLAGEGPERPRLEALIRALPEPGRALLTGQLTQIEVRDLLRATDVFALVSAIEGIPSALVEAMAVGLPCVVSDIDGMRDIIAPGVDGLQVPQGDEAALADALLALLSDPPLRLRMGRAARRHALERYTPAVVAEAHEKLYREILAEAAR